MEVNKMKIIKIKNCKDCLYFKIEPEQKKVSKDYQGYFYTINNDKQKYIEELKAYCTKKEKGYMTVIKNFGNEVFKLADDLSVKMEKEIDEDIDKFRDAENKLYNDYKKRQKIDIPDWCPLDDYKE